MGSRHSTRASRTFCWLPPDSSPTRWSGLDALIRSRVMNVSTSASCRRSETKPGARQRRQRRQHDVLPDGQRRNDAVGLAVLGDERDPGRECGSRRAELDRVPRDLDRAAVERLRAVDGLGGLRPPGSKQTGETDDLAGARLHRDVVEDMPARQVGGLQQGFGALATVSCALKRVLARATSVMARPSIIDTSSSLVMLRDRSRVDAAAVAEDGHHVAQSEDLVEPVRHVDDRNAVAPQEIDDVRSAVRLPAAPGTRSARP